jgi:cytidine deaminase
LFHQKNKSVNLKKITAMSKKVLRITLNEYDSLSELSSDFQKLVLKARESFENSYSPYSGFSVGAAVLLANGEIIKGNNQENADFTDGLCAERVALYYAHAVYPDIAVEAIAVSAKNKNGLIPGPALPCGSCRQVLVESEVRYKQAIKIILDGAEKLMILNGADSLLPMAFKPNSLG